MLFIKIELIITVMQPVALTAKTFRGNNSIRKYNRLRLLEIHLLVGSRSIESKRLISAELVVPNIILIMIFISVFLIKFSG